MKILVTGGAGFIGSHLCEKLLSNGHVVYCIDNLSTGRMSNINHLRSNPNFHLIIDTIQNEIVMDRLVSECELIFHLAAAVGVELIVTNPVEVIETNIMGTEMVLKLANRYRNKVIITSTSEIYGKSEKVPFSEEDDRILGSTTKNRWCYSTSKAVDEYLALAYHKEKGMDSIVVRLFNTVGPRQTGQYGMVLPRFVSKALNNETIHVYGDGKQIRTFGYVDDIVRAFIGLSEEPKAVGEIFNIGGMDSISILELAEKIIMMSNSSSKIEFVPYEKAYEKGFEDMMIRIPDISKIKKFINYEPQTNLNTIIKNVIDYYKSTMA